MCRPCLLVPMQPTTVYPQKPSKVLNVHFRLAANADENMKSHFRDALHVLAVLELAEQDPERLPDVVITDMDSVFDVLRDIPLMSSIRDNVWVITLGGKLPQLMAGPSNPKMRRIELTNYVNASLLGQMTMLVSLYDQECTESARVLSRPPSSGEFATAA